MKNITHEHLLVSLHEFKYSVNTWIWNVLRFVTNKNTLITQVDSSDGLFIFDRS